MGKRILHFPPRWQDCEKFVLSLASEGHVLPLDAAAMITTTLSQYELWQAGFRAGYGEGSRVAYAHARAAAKRRGGK